LINVYARKVGNVVRWQRVPGTIRFTPSMPAPAPRGQLAVDNYLFSVWGSQVKRTTADAAETVLIGTPLTGTEPVTMARNLRQTGPQVVVVADGSAYEIVADAIGPYQQQTVGDPPVGTGVYLGTVNSVDYYSGYFVFSRPNGEIVASDLQTTNWNQLSFARAESSPDGLMRVFSAPPVLLACGSDTIEVWQDVGTAPFPFQRVTVIPCGLIGTAAIAGGGRVWDRSVCFVAHDHTVRQLKGYDPVIVSNEDVSADIEECARSGLADQFRAQVYTHGDNAIWSLTGAHDDEHQWTWEYNLSTGAWHRRHSYRPGVHVTDGPLNWRAMYAAHFNQRWIAQDALDGGLIEITSESQKEPDLIIDGAPYHAPLVARCESGPAKDNPANVRLPAVYLDFTVGFDVVGTPSPLVLLSWSHDGGATWSNPLERYLGGEGKYRTLVALRNTGRSSHHGMRLRWVCADPVPLAFHGALSPRAFPSRPRQVGVVVTGGGDV
jgi:hypothetical protein